MATHSALRFYTCALFRFKCNHQVSIEYFCSHSQIVLIAEKLGLSYAKQLSRKCLF